MIYDVVHKTVYKYKAASSLCQNILRMVPRETPYQQVWTSQLSLEPQAHSHGVSHDYFGNRMDHFTIHAPHSQLEISSTATVAVQQVSGTMPELTKPWDQRSTYPLEVEQFRYDSGHVKRDPGYAAYAAKEFTPGRPILEAALALTGRIHRDFSYEPGATEVSSSVEEVFEKRKGVCQDFAHLQIACLRSLGIPARYVSGYLATTPPPGQERLQGADATHAWLSVYCDGFGWIDLDPTNDTACGAQHLTVAWGREYRDVAPVTGVFVGDGDSKISVSVDVVPRGEA